MRHLLASLLVVAALTACKGDAGPTGPQGPQGPVGPQGPQGPSGVGLSYVIAEGAVTSTTMSTPVTNTNGVFPGVVCYVSHSTQPGVWLQISADGTNTACGVVAVSASSYQGSAVLDPTMVNSGWTVRIILFWKP